MKVITEESFKRAYALIPPDALIRVLRDSFQEIDTLTVSKLRPMSDAPEDPCFVVHKDDPENLVWAYRDYKDRTKWDLFCYPELVDESELIGWAPKPTYKPE